MVSKISSAYTQLYPPPAPITEENLPSQKGRIFVVTGSTEGVGYELARILYKAGGTVYVTSRSLDRAIATAQQLQRDNPSDGVLKPLAFDLSDFHNVSAAAKKLIAQETHIDILYHNAAARFLTLPSDYRTKQGLEPCFGINCAANLFFTELLRPLLQRGSRVVWASSIGMDGSSPPNGFDTGKLGVSTGDRTADYAASKAGEFALAREMARRYEREGVIAVAMNPGNLRTNLYEGLSAASMFFMKFLLKDPKLGAYTYLYAGLSEEVKSGDYIIPWGRIRLDEDCPRPDIVRAIRPEVDGGLGHGAKLWAWCEEQWKPHV